MTIEWRNYRAAFTSQCKRGVELTVLIDKHADSDARHVEAVEEVMDAMLSRLVDRVRLTQLDDALSDRRHHVGMPVPNLDQRLTESVSTNQVKHSLVITSDSGRQLIRVTIVLNG